MTKLSGSIEWDPPALDPFLRRLAELMPTIQATPVPAGVLLPAHPVLGDTKATGSLESDAEGELAPVAPVA